MPLTRTEKPFYFKTRLSLVMLTGLKATNVAELQAHLEQVPESSVYYHTHHFLEQHQFLTPEPPNDFAYWVSNVLKEERLGERLAAVDIVRFESLDALRKGFLTMLDEALKYSSQLRAAPDRQAFHFMKSVLFNLPTLHAAHDLREFAECLKKVTVHSLYYHVFEGMLRPPVGVNDFSDWLSKELNETKLADQIARLDPYTQTMEGLRNRILSLVEKRLKE